MKIPDTSANVGAYYGNEENGQWQPNGVIMDSGVGGGVVGSGDAGIHRPPVYPVHIPRAHMPGYVMTGAYYPPAGYPPVPTHPQPDDFADYMWMENEEEFDKQVMQQLEEEALMEQCIEAMLEDEQRERHSRHRATSNGHNHQHYPTTSNGGPSLSLEETVSRSTLNPLAAEFVPTRALPAATDERHEPPSIPTAPPTHTTEDSPTEQTSDQHIEREQDKTEEQLPPQTDPPEVSAADTIDKTDKRPKDKRDSKTKIEVKKPIKTEIIKNKTKPQTVKSETKVTPKKKDVKIVKSEIKIEEKIEDIVVPEVKPQPIPAPIEETQPTSVFKPINYAAAAKANKPKKPSPTIDRPQTTPKIEKTKLTEKIDNYKKEKPKTDKIHTQRKNSAK